jgi:protein kinase-like protein/PEGA domain-containing protein
VVDEMGTGRLGPVFRAHDAAGDRFVAVKLFTISLTSDQIRRLVDEIEQIIAADLAHPSIVRPLAAGAWGGSVYLVQEYAAGCSLHELLRREGRMPIADALGIATEIAGALDSAAVAHVRHGLLGPGDVLIHGNDTRVTGFGVAQALRAAGAEIPLPPRYRAAGGTNDDRFDRRADVAALAAIVDRLLAGPRSTRGSEIELRPAIEKYDGAVRRVLNRALDPSQGDPFDHALEFVAALMTALGFDTAARATPAADDRQIESSDNRPIDLPIRPPQFLSSVDEPALDEPATSVPWMTAASPRRSRPVVWALMLAAVVALMVGAAVEYRSRRSHPAYATASASRESGAATRPDDVSPDRQGTGPGTRTPAAPRGVAAAASTAPSSESHSKTRPGARPESARAESGSAAAPVASNNDESTGSMLFVDSQPRGATLYVDDKFVGTTPLAIPAVTAGEHTVRLESDGRAAWSSPVRVRANHFNRIMVPLDR